ncbi:hypothetical protein SISSUDRAFT_80995 [Sistotremastrum suecicum HHB10207 ss-3]|uniref:Uncharacterized protein n=1 Tax=Sistotremastrum suecicum HHB10207 ss-3 TaxID=1314776 RepID=A0A166H514_9AGAM|nr:hypothetical protein SISSUDRAFT_80995 [Sistotremastrum suecicum HHB10207 ss-3]
MRWQVIVLVQSRRRNRRPLGNIRPCTEALLRAFEAEKAGCLGENIVSVVESIIGDSKEIILNGLSEFMTNISSSTVNPGALCQIFMILTDPLPTDIDLSPLLNYFCQFPESFSSFEASDRIIAYLENNILRISNHAAGRQILEQLVSAHSSLDDSVKVWSRDAIKRKSRAEGLLDEFDRFASIARLRDSQSGSEIILQNSSRTTQENSARLPRCSSAVVRDCTPETSEAAGSRSIVTSGFCQANDCPSLPLNSKLSNSTHTAFTNSSTAPFPAVFAISPALETGRNSCKQLG